jgi:hypothetical protein
MHGAGAWRDASLLDSPRTDEATSFAGLEGWKDRRSVTSMLSADTPHGISRHACAALALVPGRAPGPAFRVTVLNRRERLAIIDLLAGAAKVMLHQMHL